MTEKFVSQPQQLKLEGFDEAAGDVQKIQPGDTFGRLMCFGIAEVLLHASAMVAETGENFLGRDSEELREMALTAAHRGNVGLEG